MNEARLRRIWSNCSLCVLLQPSGRYAHDHAFSGPTRGGAILVVLQALELIPRRFARPGVKGRRGSDGATRPRRLAGSSETAGGMRDQTPTCHVDAARPPLA